ncbi:MAG: hypothetical protein HN742_38675 [Lentisphaerae bacterium]|jgi:hypothetical protein|nr:hypothetical protein [Lentisphaerota bacterium]MBT4823269.1 hypothetical protein [Lentisphaerota bacterium]MBT5606413.1 hypothetical protein [Lentisphaerota bacterium]MBT7059735.1 hypothetical protein [Lentisphaerota bacterium]MBT7847855.1 hypothetical protein [Lentisphaerota bacterium]
MCTHARFCAAVWVLVSASAVAQRVDSAGTNTALRLPKQGETLSVHARCGSVGGAVKLAFGAPPRGSVTLTVTCQDLPKLNHHYQLTKVKEPLPDAVLKLQLTGKHGWDQRRVERTYFIRPDVHFYVKDDFDKAVARWGDYPPASEHGFRLELRHVAERVEIALDGRAFTSFLTPPDDAVTVSVSKGGELAQTVTARAVESARYLPLDISRNPHQGELRLHDVPLSAGVQDVAGVPVNVVPPEAEVDVGRARWLRQDGGSSDIYDPYYRRTAWDGVPETVMFSVPRRFYNYAHVLCAVEQRGEESPSMSVRLARYRQIWDGSGATQAETTVVLDPDRPQGCTALKPLGRVYGTADGKKTELRLFLAEIPLGTGELADYLRMQEMTGRDTPDFFYLEFTRELRTRVTGSYSYYERKPLGPPSGIHVLGVTLEKAPVRLVVGSDQIGNVFYTNGSPALEILSENPSDTPFPVRLDVCLTDFSGCEVRKQVDLVLAPGTSTIPYPLVNLPVGWYSARFRFGKGSRPVWQQPLTFALLPPDTRQAGAESPYGTWWFSRSHYCEPQAEKVLPLVQKMGFRHVTPRDLKPDYGHTPEAFSRYGVSPSMMRRMKERENLPSIEDQMGTFMGDWPGTQYGMVFHETGGLPFGLEPPPELMGKEPPVFTGKDLEKEDELLAHIERHAAAIRGAAPDAKIILGNSVTNFNVHWLRKKLPRTQWDYIGVEMAVQLFNPESQPHGWNLQGLWMTKRMCELYGYDDIPITSCYEFSYRSTAPGALTLEEQANWYTRDVLHCLAYRLPSINVALLFDVDSAYYFSRWGATGVCTRSPRMMPKPSYVALATLTRVLDRAHYQRYLDTGSHSVYCLEFKSEIGFTYALWTSTGERDVELRLAPGAGGGILVSGMGVEHEVPAENGKLAFRVSESPAYLVLERPLRGVAAGTPYHQRPELESENVLDALNAADWRIVEEGDEAFRGYCPYKPLTEATCLLSPGEKGGMKLTLRSQPDVPDIVGRYVVLEPRNGSIPLRGQPDTLGAWAKGNSNWGRLVFQVEDAEGNRHSSIGLSGWDCSDWRCRTRINFDGWKLISRTFPRPYASGHPDLAAHQWSQGARMSPPVKVTRLYVILREKLVYLTDMLPATSMSIELRDLSSGIGVPAR